MCQGTFSIINKQEKQNILYTYDVPDSNIELPYALLAVATVTQINIPQTPNVCPTYITGAFDRPPRFYKCLEF